MTNQSNSGSNSGATKQGQTPSNKTASEGKSGDGAFKPNSPSKTK